MFRLSGANHWVWDLNCFGYKSWSEGMPSTADRRKPLLVLRKWLKQHVGIAADGASSKAVEASIMKTARLLWGSLDNGEREQLANGNGVPTSLSPERARQAFEQPDVSIAARARPCRWTLGPRIGIALGAASAS